jgi:uncharacterized NAD-dependent epimerase/dehydratase family protein
MLEHPYLLFLGDAPDQLAAKVAKGVRDWRPYASVGQFRLPGCKADVGLPDMTIEEAAAAGAKTLVVGVANRGGVISNSWIHVLQAAMENGMDVASGLHNLLRDEPELVATAEKNGRRLIDVRIPQVKYPIADGKRRGGKRLLTVGTDCSVGKMYTSLALIHGGQPDALVICHEPTRAHMRGLPDYAVPSVEDVRKLALTMGLMVNPDCHAVGVAVNTSGMAEEEALDYLAATEKSTGLPTCDPIRTGVAKIVDALG